MTAGFQCFNTSGTFQVDGVFPQFVLRRKVIVTPNTYQGGDGGVDDEYYYGYVTLGDDEILAICPSDYSAVVSKQGSNTKIIAKKYNTTVECFIFAQVTDVGSTKGFQVFNTAGTLVFDAMQKILAMVGFPTGTGDFTYPAGRKYAAIVMNQSLLVDEFNYSAGGFDYCRSTVTRGMVKNLGNGISVQHLQHWKYTVDVSAGMNYQACSSNVPNRIIVVDVTNY